MIGPYKNKEMREYVVIKRQLDATDDIYCRVKQQPANRTHHTNNLKTKAPNTTGSDHLYNTLELLMMGIVLSETC